MTKNRFRVLGFYFNRPGYYAVSLKELFDYFFRFPYNILYKFFVRRIEAEGDRFKKIFFKTIQRPMYYPAKFSDHSLSQVVVECFDKKNWHYYEIPQTRVEKDDVVVDCGAAEGLFTLTIYERCKHVYLIEPLNTFIECLENTFRGVENITIVKNALSDTNFVTKMKEDGLASSLSDSGEGDSIQVVTLDELFYLKGIKITYLKIDLEGFDFKALLGARELIRKYKPKIAVTTYHEKQHADQIEKFVKELVPEYNIFRKGVFQETGSPVMLHAWI